MSLLLGASWCCALAGIVIGFAALAVFRQPMLALRTTLDLLVAAGMLRLSIDPSWTAIAGTVAVLALRRLLTGSLASDFADMRPRAHA